MDQEQVVDEYKKFREQDGVFGMGRQMSCARGGKFLAAVKAPRDSEDALSVLTACIPAFFADEAVFVLEGHARHVDASDAVPIDEDPNAQQALLFVFSDRWGLRNWRLCPYGTTDDGTLEWRDFVALTTPEVSQVMELLDEVYALGDLRNERNLQLMVLQTNDYKAFIHRSAMEGL